MNITVEQFLISLSEGTSEEKLNKKEDLSIDPKEMEKLIKYGHTYGSAKKHLQTDYSNGYTVCKKCGSYYHLSKGFTKHSSNGCLNCEGKEKHKIYFVEASKPSKGGFPARYMSQMFDDGIHYCVDKLEKEKYKDLITKLNL